MEKLRRNCTHLYNTYMYPTFTPKSEWYSLQPFLYELLNRDRKASNIWKLMLRRQRSYPWMFMAFSCFNTYPLWVQRISSNTCMICFINKNYEIMIRLNWLLLYACFDSSTTLQKMPTIQVSINSLINQNFYLDFYVIEKPVSSTYMDTGTRIWPTKALQIHKKLETKIEHTYLRYMHLTLHPNSGHIYFPRDPPWHFSKVTFSWTLR